jgi:hypothetical protein
MCKHSAKPVKGNHLWCDLPCGKVLWNATFTLPKQPAAGRSRGHTVVWKKAQAEQPSQNSLINMRSQMMERVLGNACAGRMGND